MNLSFRKMHGLGNDFVVLDGVSNPLNLSPEQIQALGDRHTGIGFDQLLIVAPATMPEHDFAYLIFNPDGSQAENCGNGARCLVSFIRDRGLSSKNEFSLQLINGCLHCQAEDNSHVSVNMGTPVFDPEKVPFLAEAQAVTYPLALDNGEAVEVSVLSMGNPHAVLQVQDIDQAPVLEWGALIENHEKFPNRVNAGFMQVVNAGTIKLRVFERGVGETHACGTGACAAVVAGIQLGFLDPVVNVNLPGGTLQINWQGGNTPVLKTGPATTVFEGNIEI